MEDVVIYAQKGTCGEAVLRRLTSDTETEGFERKCFSEDGDEMTGVILNRATGRECSVRCVLADDVANIKTEDDDRAMILQQEDRLSGMGGKTFRPSADGSKVLLRTDMTECRQIDVANQIAAALVRLCRGDTHPFGDAPTRTTPRRQGRSGGRKRRLARDYQYIGSC